MTRWNFGSKLCMVSLACVNSCQSFIRNWRSAKCTFSFLSPSIQNPYASDAQDFSLIHSVDEWLASIKMSRYSDNFRAAGVLDMDAVAKMSLAQLEADLGVTLVGHQKKMMNSIQALRAQLSVNMTEGFLV